MDRDCKLFLELLVFRSVTLILRLSDDKYFFHNSCVVSFQFRNVFKNRGECISGLSLLGVLVSFVGKDQLSMNLYQKITRYCDILQRLCILKRFGGNSESLVSVESKVIFYRGLSKFLNDNYCIAYCSS